MIRSTVALFRKELRSLLPLLLLTLFVFGADIFFEPLTGRLDEKSWAGSEIQPGQGGGTAIVLLVLGLMASFSLLPREHDEKTIEFLQCLPVSRSRIFLAKALAGYAVLVLGIAFGSFTGWLLQVPNHQTWSGEQFHFETALAVGLLECAFAAVIFCHGLFLSFFRRFGIVLFGIETWVVILAKEVSPSLAYLDPTRLVSIHYLGSEVAPPWRELGFHGGIAAVAFVVAWFLWTGPAERVAHWLGNVASTIAGKLALGCGTALIVFLGLLLVIYWSVKEAGTHPTPDPANPFAPTVHYQDWHPVRAGTDHFQFTYPSNLRERSLTIVRDSEEDYARVRSSLGAKEGNAIVVDLTERSSEHAGLTSWQKIRMDVTNHEADEEPATWFRHVFVHELVHAFEFQESTRKVSDNARATAFYMEGLAEFVAHRLVAMPRKLASSRALAAAAVKRLKIRFDDLVDSVEFKEKHDGTYVYVIGESWCAGLVRAYGDRAPGDLLRAMARKDAPPGLKPLPFWQDTLQAAGYDVERVTAAWHEVLDEALAERPEFLEQLPRLSGGLTSRKGPLVFTCQLDRSPPLGTRFLLHVRDSAHVSDTQVTLYEGKLASDGVTVRFEVSTARFKQPTFEYQFGLALEGASFPWFEDWQQGSTH